MSNESDATPGPATPGPAKPGDQQLEAEATEVVGAAVESEDGQEGSTPDEEGAPRRDAAAPGEAAKKKKKKAKKKADSGAGRGVETMFRTSYRTHLDLSSLADTKANIMISINGIMISILLVQLYDVIVMNQMLLLPAAVILLGCLGSLVYAVVAARPRVTRRTVSLDDVRENKANILFFGTFVNMSEDNFLTGMWELMEDRRRTYTNMMRDLYGLGSVLEKKYRLLRTSYTIFMIGLVAGVLLFLVVYATAGGDIVRLE